MKADQRNLNSALINYGFSEIGDLFNNSINSIEKTLNSFTSLLKQIHKDIEFRKDIHDNFQKSEIRKEDLESLNDRNLQKNKDLEQEIVSLLNKHKMLERTSKESM